MNKPMQGRSRPVRQHQDMAFLKFARARPVELHPVAVLHAKAHQHMHINCATLGKQEETKLLLQTSKMLGAVAQNVPCDFVELPITTLDKSYRLNRKVW